MYPLVAEGRESRIIRAQPIHLELNLSGNSRSESFSCGPFDEIDCLTKDMKRIYTKKRVVTGKELQKDN